MSNRKPYPSDASDEEWAIHATVDTLGHLLALHVTPANEQDRAQVETSPLCLGRIGRPNLAGVESVL